MIRERSTTLVSIRAGHLDILELILVPGADLSCPDFSPSDRIPLHQAIKHNRADMAKLLLDHGADIPDAGRQETECDISNAQSTQYGRIVPLLNRGIHIDCPGREGNTVLHQAAVDDPVEHARLLIHQGMISKTTFNHEGLT